MRLLVILTLSLCIISCKSGRITGNYNIELYAHGDIHGCFFDSLYTGNKERVASLANISSFISERRGICGEENIILLDLGDNIHGDNSTHYYNYEHNYSKGEKHLYTRIAEYLGYDCSVVGNHDIETGKALLEKLKDESSFPYLAANIVGTSTGKPVFDPYVILNRNGLKVAVIGLTTHEVKLWLGKEKMEGMDVLPAGSVISDLVDEIKTTEKPHLIVIALHAETGNPEDDNFENSAGWIAANVKGIDLVLASHDHIPLCGKFWNGSDSILVVNSGAYGNELSGVKMNVSLENGVVVGKDISGKLIGMAEIPKDTAYLNEFRVDFLRVKEFSAQKLGEIDSEINPSEIFYAPCVYSNLLHYVQLKESSADVSFVSPSKYSGTVPAGEISYNDILVMYPFENLLYNVSLTGHQIKNYLELSYDNWKHKPVSFDCAGGLAYSVDFSRKTGDRVTIHSFTDNRKFCLDSTYTAAMASYRANGGGGLLMEATGLHAGQLDGIHKQKFGAIKDMLYKHFKGSKISSLQLSEVASWEIKGL